MSAPESPPPVRGQYPMGEDEIELRAKALEALLIEKGLTSTDAIDKVVRAFEQDIGPLLGARLVARAWSDEGFKDQLLEDTNAACAQLDIGGMQGEHMRALQNTDDTHHVVTCTLCSCYPWPVLGLPPNWYKYPAYRSRIVIEPRKVLAEEFGVEIPEDKKIEVWDSSSEIRYFVVPERPAGTEGMGEEELAGLVTRDSLIGVGLPRTP